MTFFDSIKTVFRKFAEFEGRATRPEFWWFALFSFLVASALSALLPYSYPQFGEYGPMMSLSIAAAPAINLAGFWSVAVLLPSLAVTVRRLRDAGHNWTNVFWILLPIAGAIILIVKLADPTAPAVASSPAAPAPAPAAPAPAAPAAPPAPATKTPAAKTSTTKTPVKAPAAPKK